MTKRDTPQKSMIEAPPPKYRRCSREQSAASKEAGSIPVIAVRPICPRRLAICDRYH